MDALARSLGTRCGARSFCYTAKPATPAANPAQLACKVTISSREDREVIILKLQQRMDCLEVKLDELNREVTVLRAR